MSCFGALLFSYAAARCGKVAHSGMSTARSKTRLLSFAISRDRRSLPFSLMRLERYELVILFFLKLCQVIGARSRMCREPHSVTNQHLVSNSLGIRMILMQTNASWPSSTAAADSTTLSECCYPPKSVKESSND